MFECWIMDGRYAARRLSRRPGYTVLAVLTLMSFPRLLSLPRRLRGQPYLTYALVYFLLWVLAFGVISNFGILARQRTQMYPFYFALLSVTAGSASQTLSMPVVVLYRLSSFLRERTRTRFKYHAGG